MVSSSNHRARPMRGHDGGDLRNRIERIRADITELKSFYHVQVSPQRRAKLHEYYKQERDDLGRDTFNTLDQQGKVDHLLLQNYLERQIRELALDAERDRKTEPLLPFALVLVRLCEARTRVEPMDAQRAAQDLHNVHQAVGRVQESVRHAFITMDASSAFRAARTIDALLVHLAEWFGFYNGYDPSFAWWVSQPYSQVRNALEALGALVREKLVGIKPDDQDAIVGEPIGREGLRSELDAEMIAYSPEEILEIGEREFRWCETELVKASCELGYGEEWRRALEHVKNQFVAPGQQTQLVKELAQEALEFVRDHDLVTVPSLCAETWQMFMMSPERQKANPFFLGGETIQVAYPTDTMDHEAKLMSLRGNNMHFSRATVFHELIPGHHLQVFMNARHRPYRGLFDTPFWIEGWSLYWEMVLWDDPHWRKTPENRVGMLFWRLHRCARILFSIKFHLGLMTPQQCIDLLVDRVGHERSTAEGEVRRSLSGDYSPLYQAAYMLGALQFHSLRQEMVLTGTLGEKEFHDQILQNNTMPIELLRALLQNRHLTRDFRPSWRFYKDRAGLPSCPGRQLKFGLDS